MAASRSPSFFGIGRWHTAGNGQLLFLKSLVTFRFEAVKTSGGCGETRFVCHWLCQCSLRNVDERFSTGTASGTQQETDNSCFFKSLVAFRFCEKTFVRGANNDYPQIWLWAGLPTVPQQRTAPKNSVVRERRKRSFAKRGILSQPLREAA